MDGCLVPTDVLVGSVVPMRVPHLARVTAPWICNDFIRSAAFRKILDWGCDNMGIFSDPLTSTVLAWRSGRPGVWVWLEKNFSFRRTVHLGGPPKTASLDRGTFEGNGLFLVMR